MTTYLHYFYENYLKEDDATDVVGQLLSSTLAAQKQEILDQQLKTALHNRALAVDNISSTTGMGVQEVESVLEKIEKDGDFSIQVDESKIAAATERISSVSDTEAAIQKLDETPQWVDTLCEVRQKLEMALEKSIGDPSLLEQYKKAVIANYMKDNRMRSTSNVSRRIIKDFLERNDGTAFRLSADADSASEKLDKNVTKSIAMLEAVDIALGTEGYSFIGKANVRHSSSKSGANGVVYGSSRLAEVFSEKVDGLLRNVNGSLAESAAAQGLLSSFIEYGKEYSDKITDQLVKSRVTGNKNVSVNTSFAEDPKYKEFMRRAKKTLGNLKGRRAKGDVTVTFGEKKAEAEVLFSASVKSMKDVSVRDEEVGKRVSINVQSGTPLATFLKREAGVSESGYAGMLQMLVGHAGEDDDEYSESELDQAWENMKELVKYRALLNSLAGFGETKDLFFIVNGSAYSFSTVIQQIAKADGNVSTYLTDNGNRSTEQGLGPRSTYQKLSPWTGLKVASYRWGRIRSEIAYRHENDILYKTKVKYNITISGVQNMMRMF